jgi:hypothetical protein
MGQFIQVNGDYNIKTYEGGIIKLDTGPGVGQVKVTGDLVVEGQTLTVSSENLQIRDNIIVVNYGETGDGVTLQYSGLQVDRGTLPSAWIVWNEDASPTASEPGAFQLVTGALGAYSFAESKLVLKEIRTDSATDDGDLLLIGTGTGVIKVIGTDTYEDQVTHDDDIPNKKYVDDAIQNNPTFQIVSDNSRVIVSDKNTPGSLAYFTSTTTYSTFGESAVSLLVDGTLTAQFYPGRAYIQDLEFINNEITNNDTNANISLRTQGTGKVQTNYAMQLEQIAVVPAYVSNSTLLYAADPSLGTTGLFYVNDSSETIKRTGELINKNKALVFSMIF